jgi:hypothetical protein
MSKISHAAVVAYCKEMALHHIERAHHHMLEAQKKASEETSGGPPAQVAEGHSLSPRRDIDYHLAHRHLTDSHDFLQLHRATERISNPTHPENILPKGSPHHGMAHVVRSWLHS